MKQIGLAIMQYEQDADEQFPSGVQHITTVDGITPVFTGTGWAGEVYPYVKSVNVFVCPDDQTTAGFYGLVCSYGFNANLAINILANYSYSPAQLPPPYTAITKLQSPAKTVMLFECAGVEANITNAPGITNRSCSSQFSIVGTDDASMAGDDYQSNNGPIDAGAYVGGYSALVTGPLGNPPHVGPPATPNKIGDPTKGRHDGPSVFLMADGHAKALRGIDVSPGRIPLASGCVQDAANAACTYGPGVNRGNAASTDISGFVATFSPL